MLARVLFLVLPFLSCDAFGSMLCFSPVAEKSGDVASEHRSWWERFDYRIQVDDGPVIYPSDADCTPYEYLSTSPVVKIWLGDEVVESFSMRTEWLTQGRNCIYFNNLYETWAVAEIWQVEKLCDCDEGEDTDED